MIKTIGRKQYTICDVCGKEVNRKYFLTINVWAKVYSKKQKTETLHLCHKHGAQIRKWIRKYSKIK